MFSRFSRRQVLRLTSLLIAGTAMGSIPFVGNVATKAQAQETSSEEVYKGRTYTIVTNQSETNQTLRTNQTTATTFDTPIQLLLDGREVRIALDQRSQKYVTPLLFAEFNSPQELARTLIDVGVRIPTGQVQLDPNVD